MIYEDVCKNGGRSWCDGNCDSCGTYNGEPDDYNDDYEPLYHEEREWSGLITED